jgi:hypothetical protein
LEESEALDPQALFAKMGNLGVSSKIYKVWLLCFTEKIEAFCLFVGSFGDLSFLFIHQEIIQARFLGSRLKPEAASETTPVCI